MKQFAFVLPVTAGIAFGSAGFFVRTIFDAGINNVTLIFIRMALGVLMMLAFLLYRDKSLLKIGLRDIPYLLLLALIVMTTNLTYNVACAKLSMAFAAVLLGLFPVYVLIVSRLLFGEEITGKKVICMVMAIAGCVMVSGLIGSSVVLSISGILLGLAGGFSYGMYSIASKFAMNKGIASLTVSFYGMLFLTIILAPFADYGAIGAFVGASAVKNILFLMIHSFVMAVIPYVCLTLALDYLEPGKVSILASGEPAAAMVFGAVFYGEIPTVLGVLGLLITMVALCVMSIEREEEQRL